MSSNVNPADNHVVTVAQLPNRRKTPPPPLNPALVCTVLGQMKRAGFDVQNNIEELVAAITHTVELVGAQGKTVSAQERRVGTAVRRALPPQQCKERESPRLPQRTECWYPCLGSRDSLSNASVASLSPTCAVPGPGAGPRF